jgi:hypothetical protein
MGQQFVPDGGGGGGGGGHPGGGGGSSGGGTLATSVPFLENGGFAATAYFLFVPTLLSAGGNSFIGAFSASNYNDPLDSSSYSYRMEDVIVGRMPTVRRVIVIYRNLGVATLTVTVSGTDDNGVRQTSFDTNIIGSTLADGTLGTSFFDVQLAAFRPQITLSRTANAGPVSIISATLVGEVEDTSL